ncbi:MAG: hypothetical protein ACE5H3_12800, partial [Planctomycetota bacterium]
GIASTLRRAVDKATYEQGAYQAARALAGFDGPEAMRLRLELFDSKLKTYRGVFLRDWFYSGMKKARTPEEGGLLARAAADRKRSGLQRILCLRALASSEAKAPAALLLERSFDKAPAAVRREWQHTLGVLLAENRLTAGKGQQEKLEARVRARLRQAGPPYRGFAVLEPTRPGLDLLRKAARSARDPFDRAEAIRILGAQGGAEDLLPLVPRALSSGHCGERTAVLETVVQSRFWGAAPFLIQALEKEIQGEQGRFLTDLGNTLMLLTHQQFGYDPRTWKRWWEKEGETFLKKAPTQSNYGPARDHPVTGLVAAPRKGGGETVASFFGLPVDSKRVSILVDGSGSMRIFKLGDKTSAEAAAFELDRYLEALDPSAKFNLAMVGPEGAVPAFDRMQLIGPRTRTKTRDFLKSWAFSSTSALFDALVEAQEAPEVDTILLISDGGSSCGSHQFAGHMLERLELEYRRTGVRIHTVCVGTDRPKIKFLQDLARITGGRSLTP